MRIGPATCRKALTEKELPARAHYNTPPVRFKRDTAADSGMLRSKSGQVVRQARDTVTSRPTPGPTSPSWNGRPSRRRSTARGIERFRARQIFRWIYRRGVTDVDAMTDLPRELRARARRRVHARRRRRSSQRERSIDGTEKFLLAPRRRPPDRVGLHPRHAGDDLLHLDAGRLRDGLRVLPDGQDGARPQPDRRRNRRSGARARRRPRHARQARSTSS